MTYKQRMELNALSKECFGTTSKWRKLLERGQLDNEYSEQQKKTHKILRKGTRSPWSVEELIMYMTVVIENQTAALDKMKKSVDDGK